MSEVLTISYKDVWYDLTDFLDDHPGGRKVLQKYNGQEIDSIFLDPSSHQHSSIAEKILEQLPMSTNTVDIEMIEDQRKPFIDLRKPMIEQILNASWTKEYYFENVFIPQPYTGSPRFFKNPFLEAMTKSPWFVVPIIWISVAFFSIFYAFINYKYGKLELFLVIFGGCVFYAFFENVLHRIVVHSSFLIPSKPWTYAMHFVIHGYHHYCPKDPYRIAINSIITLVNYISYLSFLLLIFSKEHVIIMGIVCNFLYSISELMHYHSHHRGSSSGSKRWDFFHRNHMKHHYVNHMSNYGIANPIWDYILCTK